MRLPKLYMQAAATSSALEGEERKRRRKEKGNKEGQEKNACDDMLCSHQLIVLPHEGIKARNNHATIVRSQKWNSQDGNANRHEETKLNNNMHRPSTLCSKPHSTTLSEPDVERENAMPGVAPGRDGNDKQ